MAKLYFYYSAMNAGKSSSLLQSSYNYQERGMNTLLLLPLVGSRDESDCVASRIGLKAAAVTFGEKDNLKNLVSDQNLVKSLRCVLVDEAQFLTRNQVWELAQVTDELNIPVLTYGLRSDFLGEPFEGSRYLLSLADEVVELKTICHCGRKAIMNLRIDVQGRPVRSGSQILIGGNDQYVAVCRRHFCEGKVSSSE